jgi:hypothetical protein
VVIEVQLPLASGVEPSGHVCDVDGGRAFEGGGGEGGCSAVGGTVGLDRPSF